MATVLYPLIIIDKMSWLHADLILDSESLFKQIEESVEAGVGRRADLEQISGRLSLAESNVLTELSNLHDVTARFLRLVGEKPANNLQPVTLNSAYVDASVTDIQTLLTNAYGTNPQFNATIYNIDAQRYAVDSAKSLYHPQVNLTASYGAQTRDQAALNNTITEASVGVNFSYNLYNQIDVPYLLTQYQ